MAPREKKTFWRRCRIYFRRFRIFVWLVILALLCCVLYLNQVGLPEFIKQPVLERLHTHGLDLEFTRMRWRFSRGIVAENVRFGSTNGAVPVFFVKEAQVQIDYEELKKLHLQVNGLVLREGDLSWRLGDTNGFERKLSVESINTNLRLLPGDLWRLDNFQAQFGGANLRVGGVVTNASAVRHWKMLSKRQRSEPGALQSKLRRLADTIERIRFSTPPELKLDVSGDALDLQGFTLRLDVNTPDADTPWGNFQEAILSVVLLPGSTNVLSQAELNLIAASARTPWAVATNVNLRLNLVSSFPNTNVIQAEVDLSAAGIETKWSHAEKAHVTAEWLQSVTNAIPLSGHGEALAHKATSQWGDVQQLRFASHFEPAANPPPMDESWAWWTNLASYTMSWECELHELQLPKIAAREFSVAGNWNAPNLTLSNLASTLYDGKLSAEAGVNVGTRVFTFAGASDFDIQKITPLLTEKSREWITQFSLSHSPRLKASGSMRLPAWTNLSQADWPREVRPSIHLDGHVEVSEGGFRGVRFEAATSHFSYSNLVWYVPDLVAIRPEGQIRLALASDETTRDFHFKVYSSIDPLALKPLLTTNQHRIYDLLGFTVPPVIDGELRGRWYEPERLAARATLAVTNFSVRGETFSDAIGTLEYTNLFLKVIEPRAHRGAEYGSATSLDFDIPGRKIYITNAAGVADPGVIVRAIGPKVAKLMEPYYFAQPVAARVNGVIPMRNVADADLHFELEGEAFEWWKFKIPKVAGKVDWVGETLKLRDIRADFYHGTGSGNADFIFRRELGTQFKFDMTATDADLHLLMSDLTGRTNRLEGHLSIRVAITDGNTKDLHTLQGSGRVELRDGLIWDMPIFGILSPVLDGIAPGMGLGSSRAREGTATFFINNGVVGSEDLEIRASMMRLRYRGEVDMVGSKLDARAQAELFRDTWIVGRLLSFTLWPVSKIFEYKFTGTLYEPKSDPSFFVPKILLFPLHPIRTLKDLAPEPPGSASTNAPAPLFR